MTNKSPWTWQIDILWMLVLGLWPCYRFAMDFRRDGRVGPDVISTLWGMWWLQEEGIGAVFGADTVLVNFPYGATGIVLSPMSALTWGWMEPFVGVEWALALVNWSQIVGIAWGVMWLARACEIPRPWHGVAGLSVLCARYLFFSTGEASIVSIVAMALPIGFACWVNALKENGLRYRGCNSQCNMVGDGKILFGYHFTTGRGFCLLMHKGRRTVWFWTGNFVWNGDFVGCSCLWCCRESELSSRV